MDELVKYDLGTTEYVCANHLENKFIIDKIRKTGESGKCDYCNRIRMVVPLSELLQLIIVGIEYLFEDPNESRYLNRDGTHGFDGDTFDFYDLWYDDKLDLGIKNEELFESIYKYLSNTDLYCRKDEFYSESEDLDQIWRMFKDTVKYKARFVFYFKDVFRGHEFVDPFHILERVMKSINKFDMVTELKSGTALYRTRQHANPKDVKMASDIASAPQHCAKAYGRMNPSGISMFYSSKNKELTISEVVDFNEKKKLYYTSAIFRTKKTLRLVDFTKLPETPSIFDVSANGERETLFFLREFVQDISKPLNPHELVIEYIPTQIVTEYIKFDPTLNVDGIMYPSSKTVGKNNIVLFFNHEESMSNLEFSSSSLTTKKIV